MIYVEPEIKNKIIKLYFQERRTQTSIANEFGVSISIVKRILKNYRKASEADTAKAKELSDMEHLSRLKAENEELKKEVDFLKKAAAFFAKENK